MASTQLWGTIPAKHAVLDTSAPIKMELRFLAALPVNTSTCSNKHLVMLVLREVNVQQLLGSLLLVLSVLTLYKVKVYAQAAPRVLSAQLLDKPLRPVQPQMNIKTSSAKLNVKLVQRDMPALQLMQIRYYARQAHIPHKAQVSALRVQLGKSALIPF